MKNSIIVDLVKGFFSKTPQRLVWFRNIMVIIAILIATFTTLTNNGFFVAPEWLSNILAPDGIIYLLIAAAGVQLAKKDINEGK